ncbi:hypothetical protein B425_3332 [Bacillus amyloliquefaciens]|nr:hypothetical protein B425_3332 [Bacillus amyloliquefaciens]
MASVLCQVIIFGCVFEIVKAVPCRINGTRGVTDFVFIVFYADELAAAFPA